jgi:hypothetical protein
MAVHATIEVSIPADGALMQRDLTLPQNAIGVLAFAR